MKIVKERLYEETITYSQERLKSDFETYISAENVDISPEQKNAFFNEVILPEYGNGLINSTGELFNIISDKINSYLA